MDDVGLFDLRQVLAQRQVEVIRRFYVQTEQCLQVTGGVIQPDRSVVHDAAQPIEFTLQVINQGQAVGLDAQVDCERQNVRMRRLARDMAAGIDNGVTGVGEGVGQCQADALASASDEDRAIHVVSGRLVRPWSAQHSATRPTWARLASQRLCNSGCAWRWA